MLPLEKIFRLNRIDFNVKQGFVGHSPSPNNALTLRHGEHGQGACVPWVADCICSGADSAQPHSFTGSEAPPGGRAPESGSEVS